MTDVDIQFDKWLNDLENLMVGVANMYSKRKSGGYTGNKNPFVVFIEKYKKLYAKTQKEIHMGYFRNILEKHKKAILGGKDKWLREGNVTIMFGEEVGVTTKGKLYLSSIYKMACELRDSVEEQMNAGNTEIFKGDEMKYPDYLLYYLYEIFVLLCADEDEHQLLSARIKYREGLGEEEVDIKPVANNGTNGDLLSNVMGMTSKFFEQVNNGNTDTMSNQFNGLIDVFGKLVKNPEVRSFVDNFSNDMQNIKSPADFQKCNHET